MPGEHADPELIRCPFVGAARCLSTDCPGRKDTAFCTAQAEDGGASMHQPPGLFAMAGSLARSVVGHVVDVVKRGDAATASPAIQAWRKSACLSCEHQRDGAKGCVACGCGVIGAMSFVGLDMDAKRAMATMRCPLKVPRWGAV